MSSIYKQYEGEQLQELFSNFLISSWSYSKVTTFARNEKAFEMQYIFGLHSKRSATTVAGEAYHIALEYYFTQLKAGKQLDLVELEASAFQYIDALPGNAWKLQKTTPSVEECRLKANETAIKLLRNFIKEIAVYMEDVVDILDVEIRHEGFITINGVDIPLPCSGRIDLRVRLKDRRIAIIDHKSKAIYTPEDEVAMVIGIQAITYVKLCEDATGEPVDEVWFMENKHSENKNKAPQIVANKVVMDRDTRALYEALLYEPLKRMVQAVSEPDYVYMINDADNYVDRAELYDFWARTMICEVEDFNVEEAKKDLVSKRLKRVRDASINMITPTVIKRFKENAAHFIQYDISSKNMTHSEKVEHSLRSFGAIVRVAHCISGFSSDTYLLEISAGVKITSIFSHRLDIANALNVADVRIANKMAIYQDVSYVAVEVPKKREKDLLWSRSELVDYKIPIGKDNYGNTVIWNLENHSTPHALVCGQSGSGKSVMIKAVIEYALAAGIKDIRIMDPKYEFKQFARYTGVKVHNDILDIENAMLEACEEMEHRVKNGTSSLTLIIFDEFADALAQSRKANDLKIYEEQEVGVKRDGTIKVDRVLIGEHRSLEKNMQVIAQKGRSSGFRMLAGTQRASVKVITGDTKVNFPVQICFAVPREGDSRVVLDEAGAESLTGRGDGLIKSPEYRDTVRFQAFYKS